MVFLLILIIAAALPFYWTAAQRRGRAFGKHLRDTIDPPYPVTVKELNEKVETLTYLDTLALMVNEFGRLQRDVWRKYPQEPALEAAAAEMRTVLTRFYVILGLLIFLIIYGLYQ